MSKRFAVFDIDGTIFRWQLYHELFDALMRDGIINESKARPVTDAREAWRERSGSYLDYEHILVNTMQEAIVGLEEKYFETIADAILQSKGHHVYRYTLDLLQGLKQQGYVIIAISGSHQQLVDRFAKLHGIDISVGRNYTIENGKLTSNATDIFGQKDKILTAIVKENNLSWQDSYAVGDSGGDIAMLAMVENPIAFNPDEALRVKAMADGWPIVIERKSIAYRLQKDPNGTYVLA